MRKKLLWLVMLFLSACSMLTTTNEIPYQPTSMQSELYGLQQWAFEGRMAITSKEESWSANINWAHSLHEDIIKLSGPLGQGGAIIQVNSIGATIDRGGGDIQSSADNDINGFITRQIGLAIPINALHYWVIGIPDHSQPVISTEKGFEQIGWNNQYKTMQSVGHYLLPHNMTVVNQEVKLKLVIDQWVLDDRQK